jgi:hypothetical protein
MIYICYMKCGGNADICVLAVGDDELSHGDNEERGHSSEAAEGACMKSHVDGCWFVVPTHAPNHEAAPAGAARATKFDNTTFYGYIQILLIKTNLMIYICYMKCGGNADICVLAVGDDELSMGTS